MRIVRRFRKSLIAGGVHPTRLILFGSHATGHAREDSDIDLVVISPDFAKRDLWNRLEAIAQAIIDAHTSMDVIPMTPEEWAEGGMIQDIAADGEDV